MDKLINCIKDSFKNLPLVKLPMEFIEIGPNILTPLELFFTLMKKDYVSFSVIKVRDLKKASYSDKPLETSLIAEVRLIDRSGKYLNLNRVIESLKEIFEDYDDFLITYDTEEHKLRLANSNIVTTNIYMNGLKVASIKYVQSFLNEQLSVIPVGVEFHLEHMLMLRESKNSVFGLNLSKDFIVGDFFKERESEIRSYIFDDTTIENEQLLFERYVSEAQMLIRHKLTFLAYDFILKAFNVLQLIRGKTGLHSEGYVKSMEVLNALFKDVIESYHSNKEVQEFVEELEENA